MICGAGTVVADVTIIVVADVSIAIASCVIVVSESATGVKSEKLDGAIFSQGSGAGSIGRVLL